MRNHILRRVGSLVRDVATRRRRAGTRSERDIAIEERLRVIWESTTEYAIVMLDLDGRITGWNKGAEFIFGHKEDEILGQDARILFTPEDWERIAMEMRIAQETGRAENERWQQRKDGSLFWASGAVMPLLDHSGTPVGFFKILRDMTEKKREEQMLRDNERRFRQLANLSPCFVGICSPNGQITYLNDRWYAYTGLTPEETLGSGWIKALHPDDLKSYHQAWINPAKRELRDLELRFRSRKGEYRWHLMRAEAVFGPQGDIVNWFAVGTDITTRKEEEAALLASRDRLRQRSEELNNLVAARSTRLLETVADLEEFAYTVAHDLRAPLRAIEGYATTVRTRLAGRAEPEIDALLARIATSVTRMDRLTQDVLAYGRIAAESMDVAAVDLDALVPEVLKQLPVPADAEIRVAHPLLKVIGKASLLSQSVSNLVGNALKFMPPGRAPRVRIRTEARNPLVRLWVEDNGIGIDPQYADKIFKPFERLHAKEAYEGTGIGLAIVKKAIERTGGRVGVESEPGKGSRFWLELPSA